MKRLTIFVLLSVFFVISSFALTSDDIAQTRPLTGQEQRTLQAQLENAPPVFKSDEPIEVPWDTNWYEWMSYAYEINDITLFTNSVYIAAKWPASSGAPIKALPDAQTEISIPTQPDLSKYHQWRIHSVPFLMLTPNRVDTVMLCIWNSDQIDAPVYTQMVTQTDFYYNEVVLKKDVFIDATKDLIVGFYLTHYDESAFMGVFNAREGVEGLSNLWYVPSLHGDGVWRTRNFFPPKKFSILAWAIALYLDPCTPQIAPNPVQWGEVEVGELERKSVHLTNTAGYYKLSPPAKSIATDPLEINKSIDPLNPFEMIISEINLLDDPLNAFSYVRAEYPPITVSEGETHGFTVCFNPQMYGPHQAKLQIITSAPIDTHYVTLKGGGGDYSTLNISVDKSWRGTTDPSVGTHYFPKNAVVPIKAIPNPNIVYNTKYLFDYWTGDVADNLSANTTILMDQNKTIQANFKSARFTLTVETDPAGAGQVIVEPDTDKFKLYETALLRALDDTIYHFLHWQCGDSVITGSDSLVISMESDTLVTAVYEPLVSVTPELLFLYPTAVPVNVPANTSVQLGIREKLFPLDPATLNLEMNGIPVIAGGQSVSDTLDLQVKIDEGRCFVSYFPKNLPAHEKIQLHLTCAHRKMQNPLSVYVDMNTTDPIPSTLNKLPLLGQALAYQWEDQNFMVTVPEKALSWPITLEWGELASSTWEIPSEIISPDRFFYVGPLGITFDQTIKLNLSPNYSVELGSESLESYSVYYTPYQGGEWKLVQSYNAENPSIEIPIQSTGYYLLGSKETTTDVNKPIALNFKLEGNYPNPFNPETYIQYEVPATTQVSMKIYNFLGQTVRSLMNETVEPGNHSIRWDGLTDQGFEAPSGIYILEMRAGKHLFHNKMMLIR